MLNQSQLVSEQSCLILCGASLHYIKHTLSHSIGRAFRESFTHSETLSECSLRQFLLQGRGLSKLAFCTYVTSYPVDFNCYVFNFKYSTSFPTRLSIFIILLIISTVCLSFFFSPFLSFCSRGKCSVTLLNETEALKSYLDREVCAPAPTTWWNLLNRDLLC